MARDWQELFLTGESPPERPPPEREGERAGFFRRLRENLSKTSRALGAEIGATLTLDALDEQGFERLEQALVLADVGVRATAQIVERLEHEASAAGLTGEQLTQRLAELLAEQARVGDERIDLRPAPTVIMAIGVNGTGKTTTVGKLAWHLRQELGKTVVLGAVDTFRAAAVEQLERWSERAGCELIKGEAGADPGSVAYDAVAAGRARGADVVIVDTAGRLHTKAGLMDELGKVARVMAKQIPEAPHETLLVIDATTGQNGLRQAKLFSEALPVTGIVLTKLDGTAKGGIALAITSELGIPVKLIGIGEALEDLRPFDADEFARALLGSVGSS